MEDRIVKTVELKAPVARVWRALTDHREFGEWFRVKLDGPFVVGQTTRGKVTYPGYENLPWEAKVQALENEKVFSFTWCPLFDEDLRPEEEGSEKPETLVEFKLEEIPTGTRLTISESGFSKLPGSARRLEAFRRNTQGWDEQAKNIAAHVES